MSYGLTSGEPLLIQRTVDAPFGEARARASGCVFMDAKLRSSIRAERSSLMEIRLNADLVTNEQMATSQKLLRQFPAVPHAPAPGNYQRSEPCSTWATELKSPPPTTAGQAGTGLRGAGRGAAVGRRAVEKTDVVADYEGASSHRPPFVAALPFQRARDY